MGKMIASEVLVIKLWRNASQAFETETLVVSIDQLLTYRVARNEVNEEDFRLCGYFYRRNNLSVSENEFGPLATLWPLSV